MKIEDREEFSQRVIQDLKSRSSTGMLFYLLIAFIVIFADDFYKRQTDFALLFGVSLSGICFFRLIHLLVSKRIAASKRPLNHVIFFISVGITALIWGICFAHFMALEDEHTTKLLMAICTAGLSAGGVVAFVPSLRLSVFYNFAMLAPAIVLMSIRQINLPLAIAILMFSVYMVLMANRGNREYWQALENERLLMKKSQELNFLSRIDGLTGLYNRRHFDERLDQEWKKTSRARMPPTVIICDIDLFKKINDRHGHQAGDEFLKLTASLLKTVFKRDTDIVARFGGEEFIVLLTDSTPQMALDLAEEMRRRMAAMRMPYQGLNVAATMSIGVANTIPGTNESRDALIARADKALYQAKREGRNRTIVAPWVKPSQQQSSKFDVSRDTVAPFNE
jgi:diguanylate cyclase (GGDEF)-like protein